MAFKKSVFNLLANATKSAALSVKNCRIASSSATRLPFSRSLNPSQIGSGSNVRRFLHRGALYQPSSWTYPVVVDVLLEKFKEMNSSKERLNLDGLKSPVLIEDQTKPDPMSEDAKKVLRIVQLAEVKMRLEMVKESWISYERFVEMCSENFGKEEGSRTARILDESGAVIVLGNKVFLHPQQVVKTIRELIPRPAVQRPDETLLKEFEELEREKAIIDKMADDLVRRELWCGLGFLVFQTAGFMRLTFWELSWDVMEPICFFVTSMYFMAGYAFFLRTSKEPSFEGFFQSRINSKQKKLMKFYNFDIRRYNELKRTCFPHDMPSCNQLHFDPLHIKRGGDGGCAHQ